MESTPPYAALALALTVQDWEALSLGNDPTTAATSDFDVVVERVTALVLVRIVATVSPTAYQDLSTSNICRSVMTKEQPWPEKVTPQVIDQLREFVKRILAGYKEVPYHNFEHAYHVIVSTNKLVDLMLTSSTKEKRRPPTFGLRYDPLMLMAQLFSALVHDVEHQGIPNRQLALEDDRLAILYNDQSIAENWSLYVGFSELLQDEFKDLRQCMFVNRDEYLRFRKAVINLVLATDIASPERTQIRKSKWKEAFGEPFETVERKVRAQARRMSLTGKDVHVESKRTPRRGTNESMLSQLSTDIAIEQKFRGFEDGDDDSLSITPENSEAEEDDPLGKQLSSLPPMNRSMSSHSHCGKFERRLSASSRQTSSAKYRQRLGILRSVDLSGETLEAYGRHQSIGHNSVLSSENGIASVDIDADEPNELKATVVLEVIMTAADVAHNLQGWDHMVKWSNRLYMELRKAHQSNRGGDPQTRWFENQIGFLESYLLPLARRLEDTGVFGEVVGPCFTQIVESNRDSWLTDGYEVAQKTIQEGAEKYPVPTDN